jgi:hypothetical protein
LGNKDAHRTALQTLLAEWHHSGSVDELQRYIVRHSNLPGPRGNLELAAAWAEAVAAWAQEQSDSLWPLVAQMAAVPDSQAPVNDPREMIAFCGALGIGVVGAVSEAHSEDALATLRGHARDARWRMREAVAMALQHMLLERIEVTLAAFQRWVSEGNWLEMRAAAAALAEPSVLRDPAVATAALRLHERILAAIVAASDRKAESFRVLRKGLGYTLSLIVTRMPNEGFQLLKQLVATRDPDVVWIIKQNLAKKRLARPFAERVEALRALLQHCP